MLYSFEIFFFYFSVYYRVFINCIKIIVLMSCKNWVEIIFVLFVEYRLMVLKIMDCYGNGLKIIYFEEKLWRWIKKKVSFGDNLLNSRCYM